MKHEYHWARAQSARARRPDYARDSRRRQQDNKLGQMCRQVHRTLSLSFAECHDELLQQLCIHDVLPAPDAGRLLVQVYFPVSAPAVPLLDLLKRLERVNPWLRGEVARAIVRKRAPELSFQLVAPDLAMEGSNEQY